MARPNTKQALLVSLLERSSGASSRELAASTGWKSNTVHSALSTLRASGVRITVEAANGENRYRISAD